MISCIRAASDLTAMVSFKLSYSSGLRSYRVSRFRIIYRLVQEKRIEIIAVGPRERIYEETYRLVTKKKSDL